MSFSSKCTIKRFGGRALLDSGHLALFRWWGSQREGKEGKGKEGGQGEERDTHYSKKITTAAIVTHPSQKFLTTPLLGGAY